MHEANGPQADGSKGWSSNWQFDGKADAISGTCWAYDYPKNREQFEWTLTPIGPAPSS